MRLACCVVLVLLTGCSSANPAPVPPLSQTIPTAAGPAVSAAPSVSDAPTVSSAESSPGNPGTLSDVSQLDRAGITLGDAVLIDLTDDDQPRYLQVSDNGSADFTGTSRNSSTVMSLQPALVPDRNRVVITAPFWNENLGDGDCVTPGRPLKLEKCVPGKRSQIWHLVPTGDPGRFELHSAQGVLAVGGRTGLQAVTSGAAPGPPR